MRSFLWNTKNRMNRIKYLSQKGNVCLLFNIGVCICVCTYGRYVCTHTHTHTHTRIQVDLSLFCKLLELRYINLLVKITSLFNDILHVNVCID